MRIKLLQNKQTELILKAKGDSSWPEFSRTLNVSGGYLRNELRKEERFLSEELYSKLCTLANKNYDKFIVEKLGDNWGQSKGGKSPNSGYVKQIIIPQESSMLAEFFGIMLGDGNLTVKKMYKVGTYQATIVGDSRHDREYLMNYVGPMIEELFGVNIHYRKPATKNALYLQVNGLRLTTYLESKGFKPGNKIKNQVTIPSWIKNNKDYLRVCLRGLYDTDGSAYKLTNQNSYQICFTNYNKTLLNDVRNSLILLGVNPSQITKGSDIVITRKSELRRFLNEVGFRNSRHLDKVKMWKI